MEVRAGAIWVHSTGAYDQKSTAAGVAALARAENNENAIFPRREERVVGDCAVNGSTDPLRPSSLKNAIPGAAAAIGTALDAPQNRRAGKELPSFRRPSLAAWMPA